MKLAGFEVGAQTPLFLIAGPCVIESEALVMSTAERLKDITTKLDVSLVFKASLDKANRSSIGDFAAGPTAGCVCSARAARAWCAVLTDVHELAIDEVAAVVDVLQRCCAAKPISSSRSRARASP
jgi:2-dehydro-3-deoxyphosphooctonate aldolase (KDO 8-P synthase)